MPSFRVQERCVRMTDKELQSPLFITFIYSLFYHVNDALKENKTDLNNLSEAWIMNLKFFRVRVKCLALELRSQIDYRCIYIV